MKKCNDYAVTLYKRYYTYDRHNAIAYGVKIAEQNTELTLPQARDKFIELMERERCNHIVNNRCASSEDCYVTIERNNSRNFSPIGYFVEDINPVYT